ncbi:MAG TPA: class I SAM-dependent methyltransferase [Methylomirabilota bacterium]|nr:class I SAM-dependent methyltransferase [Methylomirabilota bacterium]
MSVEYMERVYNTYSRVYDLLFGKVFQSGRELAPELLECAPGMSILEVGVGTGLSFQYLPRTIDITAIDLSQKMLDKAEERARELGMKRLALQKMDATRLEFPDNSFDRVFAAYFISTVPEPVKVVNEMRRVCKPGGYIVFCNHWQSEHPVGAAIDKIISPLCYRIGFKTDLNLRKLMRETGLEIESIEPVGLLGHWKAVRCINAKPA